jgi:hypothetical protein
VCSSVPIRGVLFYLCWRGKRERERESKIVSKLEELDERREVHSHRRSRRFVRQQSRRRLVDAVSVGHFQCLRRVIVRESVCLAILNVYKKKRALLNFIMVFTKS